LRSPEAAKTYRALCDLVNQPDTALKLLRRELAPAAPTVKPERLRELLGRLDNRQYRVRLAAQDALRKLHREAVPALRQALQRPTSLEARRRLERLLEQAAVDTPEEVRVRRALEALSVMRDPGARRLLGSLARGARDLFPTQEAADALHWGRE
jgi:hypothetical protein